MFRKLLALAVLMTVCFLAPAPASANWGYGGCGYPWGGYSWGWGTAFNSNYGWNYVPPPPYFAVHPPVYYSPYITARHYGASPYAWYAGMQPITYVAHAEAARQPEPMMIENPYVQGAAPARADVQNPKTQPVHLENPYFASTAR